MSSISIKLKKVFLAFLLIFAGTVFALITCEILSRYINKIELPYFADINSNRVQRYLVQTNDYGLVSMPLFNGYFVAPEFKIRILTNEFGFRENLEFSSIKSNVLRIMVLGDSFTFGIGVEGNEVFAKRLQNKLQKTLHKPVEVFNLGVIGYGTIREIRVFQKFKYLKPDLVILGFLARETFTGEGGNDLVDNYKFFNSEKLQKKTKKRKEYSVPLTRKIRKYLRDHSNLYLWIELYLGGHLRKRYSPSNINLELKNEAWKITADCLRKFDEELGRENIKCILLWIPYPGTITKNDHSIAHKIASLNLKNILLLDILDAFGKYPMEYYYHLDSHWNRKGHELVANLVYQKIIADGLLSHLK